MDTLLNEREVRVLGCLLEKELTTPEYYPLTLNALTNACNQKSNRDPVLSLAETDVVKALEALRFKQLALVSAEGGRVAKYRHILAEKLRLSPAEQAILAELLLRGAQTVGELRTRAERMHRFPDLPGIEAALDELMARTPPLVARLPLQAGRKEPRLAHLMSGEPVQNADASAPPLEAARLKVMADNERTAKLEEEIAALREEVAGLRRQVEELTAEFE